MIAWTLLGFGIGVLATGIGVAWYVKRSDPGVPITLGPDDTTAPIEVR